MEKANAYYNVGKMLAEQLGVENDLTASVIMKSPDVIVDGAVPDVTEFENIVRETVKNACIKLNEMRDLEGEKLVNDMLLRMETINNLTSSIKERAPLVAKEYKEKLIQILDQYKSNK